MSDIKTYKLGVMSTVWYVDAPNVDVATLAVILVNMLLAPVVNYSGNDDGSTEMSQFSGGSFDDELKEKIARFLADDSNKELVKLAAETVRDKAA